MQRPDTTGNYHAQALFGAYAKKAGRIKSVGDAVISAYVLDLFWLMQEQSETETKFE